MNIKDFVSRLDRERKTAEGWLARCPAHDDQTPSLSVRQGDAGQIRLHCFAGCAPENIVAALGLRMADLFPSPISAAPPASDGGVCSAAELPPVADWLRTGRGLSEGEIPRMWAAETHKGPAVVFRYTDAEGRRLYEKLRPISRKGFWRRPGGRPSVLYGLAEIQSVGAEAVIVVEGEMDVHALRAVGITNVVSVPDGCGSRLTPELLAPLAPFREILIATDADEPGEAFARKLAAALQPERCLRVRFAAGPEGKDANDALRAGWTGAHFAQAVEKAVPMAELVGVAPSPLGRPGAQDGDPTEDAESTDADELPAPHRYEVVDGRMCYRRTDRKGNEVVEPLANFDARVEDEITIDDGAETRREFRVSGKLASGEVLPTARVIASEFGGLAWITREWGIRAVVAAGNGTRDHLRTAIQHLSTPRVRRVYRHTGWIDCDNKKVFLYQGGAVGADGIEVDLPPPLDRFRLPPKTEDLPEAVRWSLRFLKCGPLEVTIPLLAAVYLAPLSIVVDPDTSVWLKARSGEMKSTFSALCQGHFGDFDRKTLSGSWTSTDNSLEMRLFILKDVLCVIDDYAPQADPRAQKELDRRVQRILRNVGNRASRGRLSADLTHRPDRPPRGFLLSNGEDLPPGLSILARVVPVEMQRRLLNLDEITALQNNAHRLPHAMRGYLEWLKPQLETAPGELVVARDKIRSRLQRSDLHLRQPEAVANLLLGLDMALAFAEEVGAIDHAAAEELRANAIVVMGGIVENQAELLAESDPAAAFLRVLGTMLVQGRVCLIDHRSESAPPEVEMIGWKKAESALLIPEAAHRRVALFMRETGGFWNPTRSTLQKNLRDRGILGPANDGRLTHVWRVGMDGKPQRGWVIPLALLRPSGDEPLPAITLQSDPGNPKAAANSAKGHAESDLPDPDPHQLPIPGVGGGDAGISGDEDE